MKISDVEAVESDRSQAQDSDWLVGEDDDGARTIMGRIQVQVDSLESMAQYRTNGIFE